MMRSYFFEPAALLQASSPQASEHNRRMVYLGLQVMALCSMFQKKKIALHALIEPSVNPSAQSSMRHCKPLFEQILKLDTGPNCALKSVLLQFFIIIPLLTKKQRLLA